MACKGCRGGGNRHGGSGDLSKFAYLKPNQLRRLKEQQEAEKDGEKDK